MSEHHTHRALRFETPSDFWTDVERPRFFLVLKGDGQGEYFKHSLLIVFVNRTLTCLVALVTNVVKGQPIRPIAPLYSYASISLSNVVATSCQYEAHK